MKFHYNRDVFDIIWSGLSGVLPDPYFMDTTNSPYSKELYWMLALQTQEKSVGGSLLSPEINHEDLRLPVKSWTEISGCSVTVDDCEHAYIGIHGEGYVYESCIICKSSLEFISRQGTVFDIKWQGKCDDMEKEIPFFLFGKLPFKGIRVEGTEKDNDDTILERFSKYLDPSEFIQHPLKRFNECYMDGVYMATAFFEPKPSL